MLGRKGLLVGDRTSRLILIETTTVSAEISAELGEAAERRGIDYLRAPVSGNASIAHTGALTCFVSGSKGGVRTGAGRCLASFTRAQTYLGEAEQARYAKLAVNLMIAVSAGMMAESLALARKGGIAWQDMLQVLDDSAVASPMVKYKTPPLATSAISTRPSPAARWPRTSISFWVRACRRRAAATRRASARNVWLADRAGRGRSRLHRDGAPSASACRGSASPSFDAREMLKGARQADSDRSPALRVRRVWEDWMGPPGRRNDAGSVALAGVMGSRATRGARCAGTARPQRGVSRLPAAGRGGLSGDHARSRRDRQASARA